MWPSVLLSPEAVVTLGLKSTHLSLCPSVRPHHSFHHSFTVCIIQHLPLFLSFTLSLPSLFLLCHFLRENCHSFSNPETDRQRERKWCGCLREQLEWRHAPLKRALITNAHRADLHLHLSLPLCVCVCVCVL